MAAGVIMALDLARNTGWCSGRPGETPRMGCVELGDKAHGSVGCGLDDWLWNACKVMRPSLVVYEAPLPHHKSIKAGRIALGLAMVVEMVCYRRTIRVRECAVTSVRSRVIGSGRAQKEEVMAWCERQGWKPPTHDAADAAALWELACRVSAGRDRFDQ